MNRLPPRLTPSTRVRCLVLFLSSVLLASISVAAPRGWLGVSVQDITQELREAMDLAASSGALISDVVPDGPADQAGLCTGDIVVRVDEVEIESAQDLVATIMDRRAGDRVLLTVLRGEEELALEATLRERQEARGDRLLEDLEVLPEKIRSLPLLEKIGGPQLGVEVYGLEDPDLAHHFQTEPGRGLAVLKVLSDSPAERAGIRPGDVLLRFNDAAITSVEELQQEVRELDRGEVWAIEGLREGEQTRWRGEIARDLRPPRHKLKRQDLPREPGPEELPVWTRRQARRFEREIEELRERIRDLERRLDALKRR